MEGEELSHGRETWTMKSKLYHGRDSLRAALTLSIRDKQGAFLTVAPAEGKKKDGMAGKHKGNDEGLQGDGAIDILAAFRFTETAWSLIHRLFFPV